ncbi:MAG: phosphatidylserine decarboxylase [Thermoplasmata archaeon]|jgi:phosphatidylserine decarboxylase|nr:phosphatidylserine decarboxylase [Thermoplasmata archaeon]
MAFRLARGTSTWFFVAWGLALLLAALTVWVSGWFLVPFAPAFALAILMLNFFRDPERAAGAGLVAPADGVVQSIDEWEDGRTRVAIFMNPFNVHVNRAPLDAVVGSVEHVAGGFVPAFDKESERNERVVWHFETAAGDVEVIQIAGAVARRIVPYLAKGDKVRKGERFGMIRLGSRVDTFLPPGVAPAVKLGEITVAGETTLARL